MEKTKDNIGLALASVMPEYEMLRDAPTFEKVEMFSPVQLHNERQKEYKTIDANFNVWLVSNPAAWGSDVNVKGERVLKRPAPRLVMSGADVRQAITKGRVAERKGSKEVF